MKKTKIVATIGPATESYEMLEKLLQAGMNVVRLNFSHGNFEEHQGRVNNVREAMRKTGLPAAILQDLGGPKIRIGMFSTDSVELIPGNTLTITTDDIVGDVNRVGVNYPLLPKEVSVGDIIFLHDGRKELKVKEIKGNDVVCEIIVGGEIKGKRGMNLPDSDLSVKSLTEKDIADLEFGITNKVDYMALSFVRRPSDITELRDILKARSCDAGIIAKIETPQAVENIDEIIRLCDGIMVARGDLAIEVPFEKVPGIQKMIIEKCNAVGKPVITATQMMESMIKSPVATRAEVSDVANAILDGTDAVMLSEETTLGEHPLAAVSVMSRVAREVEKDFAYHMISDDMLVGGAPLTADRALSSASVHVAESVGAKAIIVISDDIEDARMVSRFKASMPVVVVTSNERVFNKLNLSWSVYPLLIEKLNTFDDAIAASKKEVIKLDFLTAGDTIVCFGAEDMKSPAHTLTVERL